MPRRPPHLRSVPPALADALTPEQSREVADVRTALARTARQRDARGWANGPDGLSALPEFLRPVETEYSRAADLWLKLPPGSTLAEARELGRRFGLDAEATDRALTALRLAELATVSAEGAEALVSMHPPASVPF